ncbi:MAG: hypothetical protein HUJ51_02295 [Eggerthellaceae bacterium]|nr:hypothetical protein [Eggerthellaceae bacterium]
MIHTPYLHIYVFFFPLSYIPQIFIAISRLDSNPYISLIACFETPIANIVFKSVFIQTNMGISDIAIATLLSMLVEFNIASTQFISKKNNFTLVIPKDNFLSRFFYIGKFDISELNSELSNFCFGVIANFLLAIYVVGPNRLVAFSLLLNITKICSSMYFGINQSGSYLSVLMYGEETGLGFANP